VSPETLSFAGFVLMGLAAQCASEWYRSGERPMIFSSLGVLGDLLEIGSYFVAIVAGLSVVVWSFWKLSWYVPIVFYVLSLILVTVVSKPLHVRVIVTSALMPFVAAIGLVVLQWYTWFA
jgi:hypothetical protein